MQDLKKSGESCGDVAILAAVVRQIVQQAAAAQRLLDAAAMFYCGWVSASGSQTGNYSHSGGPEHTLEAGALRIEA
ncbi:MAG: hypothetical protein JOY54_20220 [Acidobacteriaceae bacterium]|nr:hypothetical protein [Acidobacteriaceae bacterium]